MPAPYDESTRETALVLYQSGKTCQEIAPSIGVAASTVARWARQAGVERPRGVRKLKDSELISDARISELRFTCNWSPGRIARETGMSRSGVRKRIARIAGEQDQASNGS